MLLSHPRCVAVGEVGIDLTTRCQCRPPCWDPQRCYHLSIEAQKEFLAEVLALTRSLKKPLVLHCRDHGTGEAAQIVLAMLHQHQMTEWPIHRHCFTGTGRELRQWKEELPRCHFGFTSKVCEFDQVLRAEVVHLAKERILLETDAPFLPPDPAQPLNTPWRISAQAMTLSEVCGVPLRLVLEQTTRNATMLYNLKTLWG
jgi:TatD DNase family protein